MRPDFVRPAEFFAQQLRNLEMAAHRPAHLRPRGIPQTLLGHQTMRQGQKGMGQDAITILGCGLSLSVLGARLELLKREWRILETIKAQILEPRSSR